MTRSIVNAQLVSIDEHTDTREYVGLPETKGFCKILTDKLNEGEATLTDGLLGWAPYTHTLQFGNADPDFEGVSYHVQLS